MKGISTLSSTIVGKFIKQEDGKFYKVLSAQSDVDLPNDTVWAEIQIASEGDTDKKYIRAAIDSLDVYKMVNDTPCKMDFASYTNLRDISKFIRAVDKGAITHTSNGEQYIWAYWNGRVIEKPVRELEFIVTPEECASFVNIPNDVEFFPTEQDAYNWHPHTEVIDGKEISVPGKFERLRLTDEQQKLVDKFVALTKEMKDANIFMAYDRDADNMYFANKTGCSSMYFSDCHDEDYVLDDFDHNKLRQAGCSIGEAYYDSVLQFSLKTNE